MDRTRKETDNILQEIFDESPAYFIDWLRENGIFITMYISKMNLDINEFLKDIK